MTEQVPNEPDFAAGTVIGGKYRVERLLGQGGMGVVYAARHVGTGRGVAIKFLLANERDLRRRMQREALALGALAHPNVVNVLDVGDHDGSVFLVMELLAGKNLREYVDGRVLSAAEAIALIVPALQGVEAAHRAGILHRDLKPDNLFVLVDDDGVAFDTKVLDFGIARPLGPNGAGIEITRSGAVVGTPKYMSPEQIRGSRELGPAVDIFSAGLMLYELVVGRSPYDATSYESLIIEIATQLPVSPKLFAPDLPDEFIAVLLRALEKRPADRFASVLDFARALEPFAPGVRFVVPRKAQLASLVDSEESFVASEPTHVPVASWVESAESDGVATKEDRPRNFVAADLALAETAAPRTPGALVDPSTGSDLDTLPRRSRARIVGIGIALACGVVLLVVATLTSGPADVAIVPPVPPPTSPATTTPVHLPPPPRLADSSDGAHLDDAPADQPTAADVPNDERRGRGRPSITDARPVVAAPSMTEPVPPSSTVAAETGTAESHGRAGTIRVEDF